MINSNMSIDEIVEAGKNNSGEISRILDSFYLKTYNGDEHVSAMCRNRGFWEPDVTSWMTKNIKPGWNCLDIGSNIGYFTEVLARLVGKEGSVYAFEPNKQLVDGYLAVQTINNYEDCGEIKVFNFGISDKNKIATLHVPSINLGGACIGDAENKDGYESKEVMLKSLDKSKIITKNINFIKMDVEGHEPTAMSGMENVLKECNLLLLELGPYHPKDFLVELNEKYFMHQINNDSEIAIGYNDILSAPHHWNVVLRKKDW